MEIIPLGARVLVKRLAVEERQTESGLLIPERSLPPTYYNKVLRVGTEITKDVHEGDTVLTTQFSGDEVRDNSISYFLVAEEDLLAVVCREKEE